MGATAHVLPSKGSALLTRPAVTRRIGWFNLAVAPLSRSRSGLVAWSIEKWAVGSVIARTWNSNDFARLTFPARSMARTSSTLRPSMLGVTVTVAMPADAFTRGVVVGGAGR